MRSHPAPPPIAEQAPRAFVLASLPCWLLLYAAGQQVQVWQLCSSTRSWTTVAAAFSTIYGAGLMAVLTTSSWIVMVIAMTAPLLARPIAQLRLRSLAQRRNRSLALFYGAYLAVWIALGPALLAALTATEALAAIANLPAVAIIATIAIVWQATPLRQRALNRCHRTPNLSAFGVAADRDCLRFGLTHGLWCGATCAPAMLLPLATPAFHLPLMFVLSVALLLERRAPAKVPSWTLRVLPGQSAAMTLFRSIRWSLQ